MSLSASRTILTVQRYSVNDFEKLPEELGVNEAKFVQCMDYRKAVKYLEDEQGCLEIDELKFRASRNYRDAVNIIAHPDVPTSVLNMTVRASAYSNIKSFLGEAESYYYDDYHYETEISSCCHTSSECSVSEEAASSYLPVESSNLWSVDETCSYDSGLYA